MMRWLIASPSPVPLPEVCALSAVKKRSNTRGLSSGRMPMPLSCTRTRQRSPSGRMLRVMHPPSGVN